MPTAVLAQTASPHSQANRCDYPQSSKFRLLESNHPGEKMVWFSVPRPRQLFHAAHAAKTGARSWLHCFPAKLFRQVSIERQHVRDTNETRLTKRANKGTYAFQMDSDSGLRLREWHRSLSTAETIKCIRASLAPEVVSDINE